MFNDAYLLNVGLLNSMNVAGIALTVSQLHLFSRGVGIMSRTLFLFDWSSFTIFSCKICLFENSILYNHFFYFIFLCYTELSELISYLCFSATIEGNRKLMHHVRKYILILIKKNSKRL